MCNLSTKKAITQEIIDGVFGASTLKFLRIKLKLFSGFFLLHRRLRKKQFNERRAAVKLSLPFSTTVKVAFEQLNNLNKK